MCRGGCKGVVDSKFTTSVDTCVGSWVSGWSCVGVCGSMWAGGDVGVWLTTHPHTQALAAMKEQENRRLRRALAEAIENERREFED